MLIKEREQRIIQYIQQFHTEHGYPPSVREIGAAVGLKSTASVARYLKHLEQTGHISHPPHKRRAWTLGNTSPDKPSVDLPLVGKITAGIPNLAVEESEDVFQLPLSLFRHRPNFLLRVQGDSMIEAGIQEGDLVAVQSTRVADNGEIVIALLEDEATVKYLERQDDHVRLLPANPRYAPIESAEIQIIGRVVGLIRGY